MPFPAVILEMRIKTKNMAGNTNTSDIIAQVAESITISLVFIVLNEGNGGSQESKVVLSRYTEMPRYNEAIKNNNCNLGTAVRGKDAGYSKKDFHTYVWMECECGKQRFVRCVNHIPLYDKCISCAAKEAWALRKIVR